MKICIDPGHYGNNYNPGVAAGYVESNFTWDYHLLLKERLERYGAEVITTRETKAEDMGLQARGKKSEGCDLFISVHSNAADNKPDLNAVFVHYSVRSGGTEIGKAVANKLTELFKKEWGKVDEPEVYGVESSKHPGYDYYGVLKGAASVGTPAIIVEHSFHTNARYCEWAMTDGNLAKMADAEAEAIAEYYGLNLPMPDDMFCIPLTQNLQKGDKGEEVKKLQMRMRQIGIEYDEEVKAHSWKNGQPDGSYGGKMEQTMIRFQKQAGIPQTGKLDAETRNILNENVAFLYYDLCGANATLSAVRDLVQ